MTVSSTTTKNSYSGDGSTTTFAYAFKIFADADLTVILRSAAGTETVQTLTTDYTVTNAGNASGGNVVFGTAPASGVTVVIRRNMAQTQSTDYVANDPFPAATHEDALDRLTFIAQQQQEELDRSIKLSRTNTMTSTEFTVGATARANKVLAFDGNGELSVTQELGTYRGTDATTTTEAYVVRDIVKSTTAGQLNNVYICVADSVVGDLLTDTDHFELLIDAVTAATSATNAASSASAAATSETNAATSESNAATSASNAATSESNASTSETNAATSATSASNSATSAASSATTATTKASEASTSAANAATSESNASTSATNAATSATNASTSETNAAASATTATTQASAASTSASNAATSASNASTSEANAAASAAAAAASADTFDDTYLGSKSSDPSVDNDGDALNAGDLYFNTTSNTLKVYTGSAWQDAAIDSSGFVQTTGDTMTGNLLLPNGAVGTPAISFSSDTNTGIYRGGTDILKFVTAGTDAVTINASGNVGIGTSSITSSKLHIDGGDLRIQDLTPNIFFYSEGAVNNVQINANISDAAQGGIAILENGNTLIQSRTNFTQFFSANTERMRIDASGNVGIGTSSPSALLTVEDTDAEINVVGTRGTGTTHRIFTGGANSQNLNIFSGGDFYLNADNQYFRDTSSNTRIAITSGGNVGIGTSSPSFKVDIQGTDSQSILIKRTDASVVGGLQLQDFSTGALIRTVGAKHLRFDTDSTERMQIDSSGNVLVGTTTKEDYRNEFPSLQNHGSGIVGAIAAVNTSDTDGTSGFISIKKYSSGSVPNGYGLGSLIFAGADGSGTHFGAAEIKGAVDGTSGTGDLPGRLMFLTAPDGASQTTERMRIDSSGRVGIGNSNPADFGSTVDNLVVGTTSGDNGITIASGTGNGGRIQFADNTASPFRGAFEYDHSSDAMIVYTAGTQRMRIDSSGSVAIGSTSTAGADRLTLKGSTTDSSTNLLVRNSADATLLVLANDKTFNVQGVYDQTTGSGANVNVASDGHLRRSTSSLRYKNTINDATHGLTELLTLRPVTYKGNNDGDTVFGGLIAEEVHDAGLTEFVQYDDSGQPDALAYGNMVSLCIKAIQELKTELDEAKARITALETA